MWQEKVNEDKPSVHKGKGEPNPDKQKEKCPQETVGEEKSLCAGGGIMPGS